ncbi:NAD(P)-dependent oxidoreductase [Nocardiopsis sp. MG754419]|uniref:NAD(P)-dependent oxidoreductase n=1 Tax=Nocardiopsis sp. MG754419 TaxID=2259865 RepID=UPI001BADF26D|nr:NAD(P)-dependent oxidoreductase [Nocardiopsis sp. MG754419]MBR8740779.1 NAD(P)-dependent oxidoreductase [Nocardiopsis sp. MG754419]
MHVGFIGLGRMGAGMARNIATTYPVTVYDTRPAAVTALTSGSDTIHAARSAAEAARAADILVTMLPGPDEVESALLGEEGAACSLGPGALWIDMSSSSAETMERVKNARSDRGWSSLDAPVTGGVPGAESGTLQIFVGGERQDYARALPVLSALGDPEKISHVGPQGAGYTVKLCINLGFFLHAIAGAEVLALGTKAGVDLRTLHRALTGSGASSAFLENDAPNNVFVGDYKEYFRLALALKDLRLAVDLGREVGVPLEVSALVEQMHHRALRTYGDGGQLLAVRQLEETSGLSFSDEHTR